MSQISTIGVIGAGQMGAGIAQVAAMSGFKTLLWDANTDVCPQALENIKRRLERAVEREQISGDMVESTMANLTACTALSEFSSAQMTIEAIVENTEIKQKLFKELDSIVPSDGILTSNTSSISITKIATATERPEKVMGAHFMNPVPVMKLVELIRGLQTSDET